MRTKIIKTIKYIISGGTAAVVDLAFLAIFVDIFKINYLISAILAFLIAFSVSFILQKFWTFQDKSTEGMHKQATIYFIVSSTNLGINTLLMYLFVDHFHIHYFLSQILASGLLAISSYFIYSRFIFKNNTVAPTFDNQNENNSQ
jgi:putative flippase GtrA